MAKLFITLCTRNGRPYFGSIINGQTDLSLIGRIVEFEARKLSKKEQEVRLEEWIILPNHVHLLLSGCNGGMRKEIKRFKYAVKNWTKLCGFDFHWRLRIFHYPIQDEPELKQPKWYFRKNPLAWESNLLNQENQLNLSQELKSTMVNHKII